MIKGRVIYGNSKKTCGKESGCKETSGKENRKKEVEKTKISFKLSPTAMQGFF
jgi:hypothetical protein